MCIIRIKNADNNCIMLHIVIDIVVASYLNLNRRLFNSGFNLILDVCSRIDVTQSEGDLPHSNNQSTRKTFKYTHPFINLIRIWECSWSKISLQSTHTEGIKVYWNQMSHISPCLDLMAAFHDLLLMSLVKYITVWKLSSV